MIFYTYKYLLSSSDYVIKGFAKPDLIFSPLVFFTMYLFYIFPFFFQSENYDKLKEFFKDKVIFFFIVTIIFILLFFYYELPQNKYGGGMIYKISQLINSNLFFIFLSYMGAILISLTINFNFKNLLVLLIFCFMFPFATVYQKYFDPLMIIIFFGMINSNLIYNNINLKKININFIFIYFIIFLVGANIHYYLLLKDI